MTPRGTQEAPRAPQDAPRRPQDSPKRPQDGPKMAPRPLQDDPKMTPSRFQVAFQNNFMLAYLPHLPRCPQDRPRMPPESPKIPPRSPQEAPRGPQEVPKRPQETPKRSQEAPKRPPRAHIFILKLCISRGRGCISHLSYQVACNMSPLGSRRGPALRASIRRRTPAVSDHARTY